MTNFQETKTTSTEKCLDSCSSNEYWRCASCWLDRQDRVSIYMYILHMDGSSLVVGGSGLSKQFELILRIYLPHRTNCMLSVSWICPRDSVCVLCECHCRLPSYQGLRRLCAISCFSEHSCGRRWRDQSIRETRFVWQLWEERRQQTRPCRCDTQNWPIWIAREPRLWHDTRATWLWLPYWIMNTCPTMSNSLRSVWSGQQSTCW